MTGVRIIDSFPAAHLCTFSQIGVRLLGATAIPSLYGYVSCVVHQGLWD